MTRRRRQVTVEEARSAWQRIEGGQSSVIAEAKALGFKDRRELRSAIVELVGRKAYGDAAAKLGGAGWRKARKAEE